jgi:CobW/HypB/UreG, nucleotide-binding domain
MRMTNGGLPFFAFVGGFLAAGKTTLIMEAARRLRESGTRVAIIINDQGDALVDTKFAKEKVSSVGEVTGACFCCKLTDLLDVADQLVSYRPQVIFAEPVGSCVDLSATLLQPLKAFHSNRYRLAPLTVLVDPDLAERVYTGQADPDTTYLFRNQIAEADLIAVTKIDAFRYMPNVGIPVEARVSGRTGEGVDEWLKTIFDGNRVVGARMLEVDYDRYADAEAAFGWVNIHGKVDLETAMNPAELSGPLLDSVQRALTDAHVRIAHLKIFDRTEFGYVRASVCRNGDEASAEGDLLAEGSSRHEVAVNLRALGAPETLHAIIKDAFAQVAGTVHITHSAAFRPGRPTPECRISSPVA